MKCKICGNEMRFEQKDHSVAWKCGKCGNSIATSYFSPIECDIQPYTLSIRIGKRVDSKMLLNLSKIIGKNAIQCKKQLEIGEIQVSDIPRVLRPKAVIAKRLGFRISFEPSFPYSLETGEPIES